MIVNLPKRGRESGDDGSVDEIRRDTSSTSELGRDNSDLVNV